MSGNKAKPEQAKPSRGISRNALLLLAGIFLLAAVPRFWALDSVPSLNQDEAVFGFEAFSIAETGRDEWGAAAPIVFPEFGGYSLPFYIYFLTPFVKAFGLSEFVVRFPSAFFGVLLALASFFLCRKLFERENGEFVGLVAAALVALTPSLVHLNRLAFSASLPPFFVVAGVFFLFKALDKKSEKNFLFAAVFFALGLYTYATAKLFIPLLLAGFAALYWRELLARKRAVLRAALVFLALAAPLIFVSITDSAAANARFDSVSIFSGGSKNVFGVFGLFASNYASYFSADYLFLSGDNHLTHSVEGIPQAPFFMLPLALAAVLFFVFRRSKEKLFLLWWLTVFPIAGALTLPAPHALRGATLTPLLQIFSAFALVKAIEFVRRNWRSDKTNAVALTAAVVGVLLVFAVVGFWSQLDYYYNSFPKKQAGWFSYGYRKAVGEAQGLAAQNGASEIIVTRNLNQPYIFFLFYERFPPALFQETVVLNEQRPGVWSDVRAFAGHRFCEPSECFYSTTEKAVFVVRGDELAEVAPAKTIYFPDGGVAFKIIVK